MHSIYLTACCAAHKGCVDNHSSGNPDVCSDFWFKHNFERDWGRCCMKLYCTPAAVIQLCLPLCTLNTKREKEKWKPEQSTKISYISSRDLHNFPFFPPSLPAALPRHCLCVLHLNAWQINWQHYFHFLEFSRISIFHSSDFSFVFISDFCVNAAYD